MSNFLDSVFALYRDATKLDAVGEKVAQLFAELKAKVEKAFEDGVQFKDVPVVLGACAETVAQIAEVGGFTTGAEKKAFAMSVMTYVYKYIDNGPTGTENRIDIPYVPATIEKWLECQVLPFLLSVLIEGVVAGYNRIKTKTAEAN